MRTDISLILITLKLLNISLLTERSFHQSASDRAKQTYVSFGCEPTLRDVPSLRKTEQE